MVCIRVTFILPLVEPAVTRTDDSAVVPMPLDTNARSDSQCRWSTVIKEK